MHVKIKYHRKWKPGTHKPATPYQIEWYIKGRNNPVTMGGQHTLKGAIKYFFRGFMYAFKYPNTVTKTFWQVAWLKLLGRHGK